MCQKRTALALGGCGHLVMYELGVAVYLMRKKVRIDYFSGSSAGAIVATACSTLWGRSEFIKFVDCVLDSGDVFGCLRKEMLELPKDNSLFVCVTKCKTGEPKLLTHFDSQEQLSRALIASCTIPASAHPFDLLQNGQKYPEHQGIWLPQSCVYETLTLNQSKREQDAYIDGALSASIPSLIPHANCTISVSPIAGLGPRWSNSNHGDNIHICPPDTSLRIPFIIPKLAGLPCFLSLANLRALPCALFGGNLDFRQRWYDAGMTDAELVLSSSSCSSSIIDL